MKPFVLLAVALLPLAARAQNVGIGTAAPDSKAALDITATGKGLLVPRMSETARQAITSPPQGLLVFQRDGAQPGFWYATGSGNLWLYLPDVATARDNLGDGVARTPLNLNGNKLLGGTAASPSPDGLQVDGSGRVGVGLGSATPAEQLQVDGGHLKIGLARWTTSTNDRQLKFGDGDYATLGETGGDDLLQFRAKDFRFNASGVSGYTGNVGIGLGTGTAATERLEVAGSIKLSGTAGTDGLVFPDGTRQTTAVSTSGGLTLPYAGSASTGGNVFSITNSGAGIGVRGASASGQGVVGRVNGTGAGQGVVGVKGTTIPNIEDAGVVGLSEADYAVYGRSSQSTGVVGVSDGAAANLAGVQGSSTASNGVGVLGTATGTGVRGVGTNGAGIDGTSSANANTTGGVVGRNTSSPNGVGVLGVTTNGYGLRGVASASGGYGLYAEAVDGYGAWGKSTSGEGVYGLSTSNYGVHGYSVSSYGVFGATSAANTGTAAGVWGNATIGGGIGVLGQTTTSYGVRGEATGTNGYGVAGVATGSLGAAGVWGSSTGGADALAATASANGRAAFFTQSNSSSTANGLEVQTNGTGRAALFNHPNGSSSRPTVEIKTAGTGGNSLAITGGDTTAVLTSTTASGYALKLHQRVHDNTGVKIRFSEEATTRNPNFYWDMVAISDYDNPDTQYGIFSINYGPTNRPIMQLHSNGYLFAPIFDGSSLNLSGSFQVYGTTSTIQHNLNVLGTLYKAGGSFKIDHPLDPARQYLSHSFVESPDMLNVYNGNVTLDAWGEAVVELPDYFEALNRDFRYQLTSLGAFMPVFVQQEVAGNRFRIAGGQPGGRVSWQVTGIRQDKWANQHRIKNAELKEPENQGKYLHPELFGQPAERGITYPSDPPAKAAATVSPIR